MKLFIAITLFVVVSALPRRNEVVPQEESPIVFRHWEQEPESHVRKHKNDYIRIEKQKNSLNALAFPPSRYSEANDSGDRKITPQDVINALNVIHQFLNNNGEDDDDESIIAIDHGYDENQSDLVSISGEVANSEGPDSEDENIVNESQQSNNDADGQNVESVGGEVIPNEHQSSPCENSPSNGAIPLIDVVQPEHEEKLEEVGEDDSKYQRFVHYMPWPLEYISQYTHEGTEINALEVPAAAD